MHTQARQHILEACMYKIHTVQYMLQGHVKHCVVSLRCMPTMIMDRLLQLVM